MVADRLSVLEELARDVAERGLEPSDAMVLQERIEDALTSSTKEALRTLASELQNIVQELVRRASPQIIDAVGRVPKAEPELVLSHSLGAVSFAQALVDHSLARRADDEFCQTLKSRVYRPIVDELLLQPRSGVELSRLLETRVEVISRKLKTLRQFGVVDYRREGTSMVNFLTPAALCALREVGDESPKVRPRVAERLEAARATLDEHLRDQVSWGDGAPVN